MRVPGHAVRQLLEAMDAWLAARGLLASLSRHGGTLTWMVSSEAGQATEADRAAVVEWAREHGVLAESDIGPLGDLRDA